MHASIFDSVRHRQSLAADQPPKRRPPTQPPPPEDFPLASPFEPAEPSDLEEIDVPWTDAAYWDVFIPDDDQYDPLPDHDDFFGSMERGARSMEPD